MFDISHQVSSYLPVGRLLRTSCYDFLLGDMHTQKPAFANTSCLGIIYGIPNQVRLLEDALCSMHSTLIWVLLSKVSHGRRHAPSSRSSCLRRRAPRGVPCS